MKVDFNKNKTKSIDFHTLLTKSNQNNTNNGNRHKTIIYHFFERKKKIEEKILFSYKKN